MSNQEFCRQCGALLAADARFCETCGTPVGDVVHPAAAPAPSTPQATRVGQGVVTPAISEPKEQEGADQVTKTVSEAAPGLRLPWSMWGGAAFLIFLDALLLSQGFLSLLVILWQLIIRLPAAFFPRNRTERGMRLSKVGIYSGAAVLSVAMIAANNYFGDKRADEVVAAVSAYKDHQGRYPKSLDELVPVFVPAVPLARYSLSFNAFHYTGESETRAPALMYVNLPPFGRRVYRFDTRAWNVID